MFKNNRARPMSREELYQVMQDYKRKLWAHIEERQSHQINKNFVEFAERQIEEINYKLNGKKAA